MGYHIPVDYERLRTPFNIPELLHESEESFTADGSYHAISNTKFFIPKCLSERNYEYIVIAWNSYVNSGGGLQIYAIDSNEVIGEHAYTTGTWYWKKKRFALPTSDRICEIRMKASSSATYHAVREIFVYYE